MSCFYLFLFEAIFLTFVNRHSQNFLKQGVTLTGRNTTGPQWSVTVEL